MNLSLFEAHLVPVLLLVLHSSLSSINDLLNEINSILFHSTAYTNLSLTTELTKNAVKKMCRTGNKLLLIQEPIPIPVSTFF